KRASSYIFPRKIRFFRFGYQKSTVRLGELGKIDSIVLGVLCVYIHRCFRTDKGNIYTIGQQGGHRFVATPCSLQFHIHSFFFKNSFFQCDILWCIKDRTDYLDKFNGSILVIAASRKKNEKHTEDDHKKD